MSSSAGTATKARRLTSYERACQRLRRSGRAPTPALPSGRAFCQLVVRLGSSSWLCHSRAHLDEQNGSLLLRANSGRSPPQPTQRPSGCTGGFALIGGRFSTRHERTDRGRARGLQSAGGPQGFVATEPQNGCGVIWGGPSTFDGGEDTVGSMSLWGRVFAAGYDASDVSRCPSR